MAKVSDLASPSATRAILDRFDLAPKKSFGQNFLVNDDVIRKILELSGVSFDDVVLEVGPGIGTLTNALLKHVRAVVAVERDADLPFVLAHTLQKWEDRFHLVKKDALDLKVDDMGDLRPNLFVANLPYSVAATLVLDYFWRFPFIDSATVMVQREVAERMMAKPGTKNYGAYTVKLSMVAEPVGHFIVKPDSFMPRPHVDSAVIRLNRIASIDDEHDKEVVNIASIMRRRRSHLGARRYQTRCAPISQAEMWCVGAFLPCSTSSSVRRGSTRRSGASGLLNKTISLLPPRFLSATR